MTTAREWLILLGVVAWMVPISFAVFVITLILGQFFLSPQDQTDRRVRDVLLACMVLGTLFLALARLP